MRIRKTYIVDGETTVTSGTKIYDLDFKDPLRVLQISLQGKRYDKSDTNRPYLLEGITKIEIVDGSDVIYSTTGTECAAVELYHTGKMPFLAISANHVAAYNRNQVKILFGLDESDNKYGLDLTVFKNPQLKITHNYTESAGHWASETQNLTVIATVAEGAPKPSHFLMTKEIYTWTKATTGDVTIDLPRDYPYRFIVLQATHCATPVYEEFTQVKISCNYDEFVPLDMVCEDIAHDNWNHYGMLHQQVEVIGENAAESQVAWYPFAWNWGANAESWNTGTAVVVMRPYSGYITVNTIEGTGLPDNTRAIITGRGFEFFDTEVIRFGNLMDPEEYFDPKPWKSLRLILTQAQTAVASAIVIQQVRPNRAM